RQGKVGNLIHEVLELPGAGNFAENFSSLRPFRPFPGSILKAIRGHAANSLRFEAGKFLAPRQGICTPGAGDLSQGEGNWLGPQRNAAGIRHGAANITSDGFRASARADATPRCARPLSSLA